LSLPSAGFILLLFGPGVPARPTAPVGLGYGANCFGDPPPQDHIELRLQYFVHLRIGMFGGAMRIHPPAARDYGRFRS
jgi:hypothetical protein